MDRRVPVEVAIVWVKEFTSTPDAPGSVVAPGTIRKWAERGHIGAYGETGPSGRRRVAPLYDLDEISAYLTRRSERSA